MDFEGFVDGEEGLVGEFTHGIFEIGFVEVEDVVAEGFCLLFQTGFELKNRNFKRVCFFFSFDERDYCHCVGVFVADVV